MRRRLLAVVTVLAALVCVLLLPATATENSFRAGYGTADITPEVGLPMSGYGDPTRLSTANEGSMQVACIAVTDAVETTALFISVDTYNTNQLWSNDAKTAIVEKLGANVIDIDRIYISATGTMSAPELLYTGEDDGVKAKVDAYRAEVINACATAAYNAMEDRCQVTLQESEIDTSAHLAEDLDVEDGAVRTRMNYNFHYLVTNENDESWVAGNGFGPVAAINSDNYTVKEVTLPDDTLGLLRFTPVNGTKTPIVLANWSARANLSSTASSWYGEQNHTKASADYVGYFRDAMTGTRTAFFQGTAGNIGAMSLDVSEQNPDVQVEYQYTDAEGQTQTGKTVTPEAYGKKLATLAQHCLEEMTAAQSESPLIKNMKVRFATEPDVPSVEQVMLVNALKNTPYSGGNMDLDEETDSEYTNLYEFLLENWSEKAAYEESYTGLADLVHPAELSAINTRMLHAMNGGSTNFATDAVFCDTTVLTLGDITFAMAPADLYDNYGESDGNGGYTKTWAETGVDFALSNTNGSSGYLASSVCYTYNNNPELLNNGTAYYQGTNITLTTPFRKGAGEQLMETYANVGKTLNAEAKMQCECGGLAVDKPGHTCQPKEFLPWYDPDSLPVSGNYYLMTDVTLYREARTGTAHKSIDLNGHTITRKVLPEVVLDITGDEVPTEHYYTNTRLFALESNARLTITDTVGGGKLTRDISALDTYGAGENEKINNYGLLIAVIDGNVNENIIYKAELDASGQYSGGGACVANLSENATVTMYDGTMTGGISDRGTALYTRGQANLYGGTITGGTVADTTADDDTDAQNNGVVDVTETGKLLLAGNASVTGGKCGEKDNNISVGSQCLTVDPGYTGTAGITVRGTQDPNSLIIGTKGEATDELLAAKLTVDNFDDYCVTTCQDVIMVADIREYCVCGGTEDNGQHGHTRNDIQWKPWPIAYSNYLPASNVGGNYYLMTDITLSEQRSVHAPFRLDLNGHDITRVVDPAAANWADNTRVFYVAEGGSLSITDSTGTENPGVITRDLSKLTDEQKAGITNWGLIILMNEKADGDCELFNGILDATDQVSGGGACVANLTGDKFFHMHGGKLLGGKSASAGVLYSSGPVEIHGGTITGGVGTGTGVGGIRMATLGNERSGSLRICSDATVTGNVDAKGNPSNIYMGTGMDKLTVIGEYTGTAGVILNEKPYHGMQVAVSENANIDNANFTADNYQGLSFAVDGGYIVVKMDAAYITYADETPISYYKTLQEAFSAYPGGKATVTLQRNVEESELSVHKDTFLNLTGFDVVNTTFTPGANKLYVFDTQTDDYTVSDENYGTMTGEIATGAQGVELDTELAGITGKLDHYLKITEGNKTSFHRLNLRMAGITLNTDSMQDGTYWPGLFYNAQFGGDEVIQRNMEYYGVALNVRAVPDFRDKTYTKVTPENWQSGTDANGNSLNLGDSMKLRGILKHTNTFSINSRNAGQKVFGQAYVRYNGVNFCGPVVSYSLRDVFEGTETLVGVETGWENLNNAERESVVTVFNTYSQVMRDWDIPTVLDAAGFVQPVPTLPNQTQPTQSQPTDPLPEE